MSSGDNPLHRSDAGSARLATSFNEAVLGTDILAQVGGRVWLSRPTDSRFAHKTLLKAGSLARAMRLKIAPLTDVHRRNHNRFRCSMSEAGRFYAGTLLDQRTTSSPRGPEQAARNPWS